jgi:type I restriction enzyme S subunit
MTEWRECKIKDIGTVITGTTPSSKIPEYFGTDIPFVTPTDFKYYFKYCDRTDRFLSKIGADKYKNRLLPPQSVLVTCIGSDMGKVAISKEVVITNQQINSIIVSSEFSSDFVYYSLIAIYDTLRTYGQSGTAVPIVNKTDFENITLLIPPLPEQKAIAEVLSSLDDKIDFLTRQNNTLEDFAQTYFRRWFLEENDNDTIMVSEIAKLENNSVSPKRQPLEPFHHYSIPAYDNAQTPVVELGNTILSNKFTVQPNSILVSKLNPITPRIWRIDENVMPNSVCSTEFQVLKPYDIKHYLFLYFLMKSDDVVSSFAMSATGTSGSHQRIRPEYILEVETPEPDNDKLILFNEICTPMMERVKKNQQQIITLQKLRDTLLPKLISGEVRVKQ